MLLRRRRDLTRGWRTTMEKRLCWPCVIGVMASIGSASCTSRGDPSTAVATSSPAITSVPPSPYTLFESGQVRPLALSPDGSRLFAVNTPDGRLEMYGVTDNGLVHKGSIPVGLEPVAVAARTNNEVWVVNHLSDSVSIVKVNA